LLVAKSSTPKAKIRKENKVHASAIRQQSYLTGTNLKSGSWKQTMSQSPRFELNDLISPKNFYQIEEKLRTYGVAVIPSYVEGEELFGLIKEYESMRVQGKNLSCPSAIRSIGGVNKDYFAYDQHLDKNNLFPDLNSFFPGT
jgi:hypothetical protein